MRLKAVCVFGGRSPCGSDTEDLKDEKKLIWKGSGGMKGKRDHFKIWSRMSFFIYYYYYK